MRAIAGKQWVWIWLFAVGAVLCLQASVLAVEYDSDVSDALRNQVQTDFAFMASVEHKQQSQLHQEIFGSSRGPDLIYWFEQRVRFFGVDRCGGPSAVACVKVSEKNKIYVSPNYLYRNYPQIARLMTLYHEARHTETDQSNWPHAKCPRSFPHRSIWTGKRLRNDHACDSTVYGSYGSATVLIRNLARFCSNCTEKMKMDAKIYSDDQAKRLIGREAQERLALDE